MFYFSAKFIDNANLRREIVNNQIFTRNSNTQGKFCNFFRSLWA